MDDYEKGWAVSRRVTSFEGVSVCLWCVVWENIPQSNMEGHIVVLRMAFLQPLFAVGVWTGTGLIFTKCQKKNTSKIKGFICKFDLYISKS